MKKIINYIAAVGMIMSAVSCSFTDLEPTDKVPEMTHINGLTVLPPVIIIPCGLPIIRL